MIHGKRFFETCDECGKPSDTHVLIANGRKWANELDLCTLDADKWFTESVSKQAVEIESSPVANATELVRFDFDVLVFNKDTSQEIYLRENNGLRRLSFTIGYFEASSLYWGLSGSSAVRPATYQAFASSISELGGKILDALIYGVSKHEKIFHSCLRVQNGSELLSFKMRSSDAINLAAVTNTPIFVSPAVLAEL